MSHVGQAPLIVPFDFLDNINNETLSSLSLTYSLITHSTYIFHLSKVPLAVSQKP
jgi:hypothetical protein